MSQAPIRPRRAFRLAIQSVLILALSLPAATAASAQGPTPLDPPDIGCAVEACNSITLSVCGGGWGGAPAGSAPRRLTRPAVS